MCNVPKFGAPAAVVARCCRRRRRPPGGLVGVVCTNASLCARHMHECRGVPVVGVVVVGFGVVVRRCRYRRRRRRVREVNTGVRIRVCVCMCAQVCNVRSHMDGCLGAKVLYVWRRCAHGVAAVVCSPTAGRYQTSLLPTICSQSNFAPAVARFSFHFSGAHAAVRTEFA